MSWRRILLFSLIFVVALGAATWGYLQHSDAATRMLRNELEALLTVPSRLETTSIDLASGRLTACGLRIDDPTRPGKPLVSVEKLHVDVAGNPLGPLVGVHSVVVEGIDLDLGPELPTLEMLLRSTAKVQQGPAAPPTIPHVAVRGGRVRFSPRPGVAPIELFDLDLEATPIDGAPMRAELLGTATLRDLATTVHLRGTLDVGTRALRLLLSVGDIEYDRAHLNRVRELTGFEPAEFEAAGHLRELKVLVSVSPRTASEGADEAVERSVDIAWELDNVRVSVPDLPGLVNKASLTGHFTTRAGGSARAHFRQQTATGKLEVLGEAKQLFGTKHVEIRAKGNDVKIDHDVRAALRTFTIGRQVLAALRPTTGNADLDLFLANPHEPGGIAELDLVLRDVAMSYHGFGEGAERVSFPLPLVAAHGRVRLRDNVVYLEDVHASIHPQAGGGSVTMNGQVDTEKAAGDDTTLDIAAEGVAFNSHLREALRALLHDEGALYDKLSPSGRTEVAVRVRPRSELAGGWSVEVRPTGALMSWAGFPYRLESLRGRVVARQEGVRFDLTGAHGSGTVSMQGRIPLDPAAADGAGFEAVIALQQVTIDDDLRRAVAVLAPDIDAPWRAAAPQGRFDGRVKVWRPTPTDPLFHDVHLELGGVDLELPFAPWRAVGLRGPVLVQGADSQARIDFDALRGTLTHGSNRQAQLAMLGFFATGDALNSELTFVVRDLELDDQIGTSLEHAGALDSGTWAQLKPSGKVDLVCVHEHKPDAEPQVRIVVQLVDVASNAAILPRPAEHMTGELTISNGEMHFDDVRANLGKTLVQCSDGHVRTLPDGRTELRFMAQAKGFPVDDGLANLFAGPLKQAVLDRRLAGRADVDQLSLQFAMPGASNPLPFETRMSGQLRLYDVELSLGQVDADVRVQGISGVMTLDPSTVSDTGGGIVGRLQGGSLWVFGQPFENIETSFTADAERLELVKLTSRFHGGVVNAADLAAPALRYMIPGTRFPEGRLSGDLAFERVDVYQFLDTAGWTNPPYSGLASGRFSLVRLDGTHVVAAEATGSLKIEQGDLGVVPLFTAIYAQLPAPDRPRFHYLESTFRLADRRVTFDSLDVRSRMLGASGIGSLDLDGYVDIKLQLNNLLGTSADPFLMPLIEELTKNIVRFHLFGYLRDLRAEKRWILESSPRRRGVVPMPPASPRQALPDY
ncbi:MAG TPA: hypothetical protein VF384_09845 [Planctomycetota bacterium]